jgi:hypothetical protein
MLTMADVVVVVVVVVMVKERASRSFKLCGQYASESESESESESDSSLASAFNITMLLRKLTHCDRGRIQVHRNRRTDPCTLCI